jgi:peptide-methionine (S)-S-oxide reductase
MLTLKNHFIPSMLSVLAVVLLISFAQARDNEQGMTAMSEKYQTATFAGGCFWCVESDFDKVAGVVETVSGYMGGHVKNPGYKQVSAGGTGHAEVVRVTFDPEQVSYTQLLEVFWHSIDPTVRDQQFCDKGRQYRSAVFYQDEQQQQLAEQSRQALEQSKPFKAAIVTEIEPAKTFYAAEDYHQNYYKKNPLRYKYYRHSCGRDQRLQQLWGKAG